MKRLVFILFFSTVYSLLYAQDATLITRRYHNFPFSEDTNLNGLSGVIIRSPFKDIVIDYITIGGDKNVYDIKKNDSVYLYKIPINISQNDGEIEITLRQKNNSSIQGVIKDKQLGPNKWSVWEVYPYEPYIARFLNRTVNVCTYDGSLLEIYSDLELVFNNLSEYVKMINSKMETKPDTIYKYTIFVPKEAIKNKPENLFFTIQTKNGESNELLFDLLKDGIDIKTTYYYGVNPIKIGISKVGSDDIIFKDDSLNNMISLGTNVVLPFPNPLALLSLNVGYQWKSGWNLEGGLGFTPAATSDKIYVYDKSGENVTPQDYRKYQVYGHVGYDFGKNKDFCLMPQVGFAWDCITNKTFGKTDTSLNGFNTYSATLGLRLGYKFKISKTNKLLLYATPEIAKVWNSPTSNYEVISKNISSLKQTGDGLDFRLRIGLQLYLGGNKR